MKVLLLTLLLVLLCSTQVLTLRCFTCEDDNDTVCKTETECAEEANYCMTYEKGDKFSRSCEEFCADDFFTHCCERDLCGPGDTSER